MREFIYYSSKAPTAGSYVKDDLQKSGRLDIAIHSIISAFFLSHQIRTDTILHLLFTGQPTPPRHLTLNPVTKGKTDIDKIYINKKNVADIIKKMLYKYKEGKNNEVFPGYFIEKKGFLELANELVNRSRNLYILDTKGEDIRKVKIKENPVFILGDHLGMPQKELKRLKKLCTPVSIGKTTYFASQTITIVQNELDRRAESS